MSKKILAAMLVLCMVLALGLTACSKPAETTTTTTTAAAAEGTTTTTKAAEDEPEETTTAAEGGEEEITTTEGEKAPATWDNLSWMKNTEPVTMSAVADFDWYGIEKWGEDEVSKEINRLTGVTLDFQKLSDPQILSVQIAAQELSDIVFMDNMPQRMETEDLCFAWNKLIPEYCPEFWDLVDDLEKVNNTASDGNIYTFKTHYKNDQDYANDNAVGNFSPNATISYRMDITDKLGIKTPFTTVEDFEAALYTVKEHASEVGVDIVFNMHPSWSEVLSYWMGCPQNNAQWDTESKSIKLKFRDEKWLEYYKLLNKWMRDGLLAKDYLAVRPEDFFARDDSCVTFATSYNWGYAKSKNSTLRQNDKGGKFDDLTKPVWHIMSAENKVTYKGEENLTKTTYDYGTGWASCFIANTCATPDRAICYMEFLKSPQGDHLCQWGIEGVHYDLVDGLPVTREDYKARDAEQRKGTYTGIGPWYFQGSDESEGIPSGPASVLNAMDEWAAYDAEQDYKDRLFKKKACYENKNPAMTFARIETDDDCNPNYTKITDQWSKSVAVMITAESEDAVVAEWNNFQQYMADNGVEAVEKTMTDRYVAKLKFYQENGFFTDIVVD